MDLTIYHFLTIATLIFIMGITILSLKKDIISLFIGVEFIIGGVNINFLSFSYFNVGKGDGGIFTLFSTIITFLQILIFFAAIIVFIQKGTVIKEVDIGEIPRNILSFFIGIFLIVVVRYFIYL